MNKKRKAEIEIELHRLDLLKELYERMSSKVAIAIAKIKSEIALDELFRLHGLEEGDLLLSVNKMWVHPIGTKMQITGAQKFSDGLNCSVSAGAGTIVGVLISEILEMREAYNATL